jgi:hypothetical protein
LNFENSNKEVEAFEKKPFLRKLYFLKLHLGKRASTKKVTQEEALPPEKLTLALTF